MDSIDFRDIFAALARPFSGEQVRSRSQGGLQLTYVTARTVMNRLDEVLGPSNWWDEYTPLERSVVCRLTIRLPDGTTVTKSDAGGMAGMADQSDVDKSGFSDAFKRAAVKFGVGRHLYGDGVPAFAHDSAREKPSIGEVDDGEPTRTARRAAPRTGGELHDYAANCKTDPALAQWIAETFEERHFPHRLKDWTESQVGSAWPVIRQHLVELKGPAHRPREKVKQA